MISPLITAIVAACALAALIGSYAFGRHDGRSMEIASQVKAEEFAKKVEEASLRGAATAISQIKVNHVTIKGRVEREVRVEPRYLECVHTDATLRLLNDALENKTAGPLPAADRELPEVGPPR